VKSDRKIFTKKETDAKKQKYLSSVQMRTLYPVTQPDRSHI